MTPEDTADPEGIDQRMFRLGELIVEPSRNLIKNDTQTFSIEPMIMDVLCLLAGHSREVVTRNRLIKDIWGVQYGSDESLTRAISLLRKTFRSAGEPDGYIETIPKSGYRLRKPPIYIQPTAAAKVEEPAQVQIPKPEEKAVQAAKESVVYSQQPDLPRAAVQELPRPTVAAKMSKKTTVKLLAGFMVLAIVAAIAFLPDKPLNVTINSAPGNTRSVGVLSFADMSAKQDQGYFTDGMAEEILHSLAAIPDIRVAGRTSSFSFKGKNLDMREIGKSLNVSHLVDGSVRKQGDNLRITVQLINTNDGLSMWSKSYDGTLENFLALQRQVSSDIVSELKVVLSVGIEQVILLDDIAAPQTLKPAGPDAKGAKQIEPAPLYPVTFARALDTGQLGAALTRQMQQDGVTAETNPLAEKLKGLRVYARKGEWSYATDLLEQARENSPLSPEVLSHATFLYHLKGDAVAARQSAGRNLRWNPENSMAATQIADEMQNQGDIPGAHQALLDALRLSPDEPQTKIQLAVFYARLGLKSEALEIIESNALKIMPLILLGDREKALRLLKREGKSSVFDIGLYSLGDKAASYNGLKPYALEPLFTETSMSVDTVEIAAILTDVFQSQNDPQAHNFLNGLRNYFDAKDPQQISNHRILRAGVMYAILMKDEIAASAWVDAAIKAGLSDVSFLKAPLFDDYRDKAVWKNHADQISQNARDHYRIIRNQRSAFIGSDLR